MTSLDELRSTLDRHAALAPDATGLVEQAQAGAVRLRRRNRVRAATAAAVAVALVVAVSSIARSRTTEPLPNPAGPMAYYREPSQLTLGLVPGPVYAVIHGMQGGTQFLIAWTTRDSPDDTSATYWSTIRAPSIPPGCAVVSGSLCRATRPSTWRTWTRPNPSSPPVRTYPDQGRRR